MLSPCRLTVPVSGKEVRKLRVGDVVYLSGTVHTMMQTGHRRAIELLERGLELPFDLREGAVWHCGPITRNIEGKWETCAAGPTSSSKFTELGATLMRKTGIRVLIGKGTMGPKAVQAIRDCEAAYLAGTGGCAALYARKILKILDVFWLDLGMPEATWVFEVKDFGPLVVGIDSSGNSLQEKMKARLENNLKTICRRYKVDATYNYVWWPQKVMGSSQAHEKD